MKIKNLQINVLALLFGFAVFCFVNKMEANNATKSPEEQQFFDQNGNDVSGKNQKSPKRGATLSWDFHGPTDASGKVTSIVHNSSNYNIVYVGAAHNGVWKSTNGTVRWDKIPVEPNKNLYVTCLALDEASNTLYAGTGGDFIGQGIYKAEGDGPLKLMSGTENWKNVYKIVVSGNKVYAATSEGLMYSTGGTWQACTGKKDGNTVTFNGTAQDVSINAAGLVIAAVNKTDCYVSKTGAFNEFEYKDLDANLWYMASNISVTTSPADNGVLYVVATKDSDGKVYKAFLSEDKGDTWEIILEWFSGSNFVDPLEGNGKNINKIYADPIDPYTLYIASRNIWKGTRYVPGPYDFGLSAISMSDLPADHEYYLHSNVRSIDFVANLSSGDYFRYAYLATDGGVFRAEMYISLYTNITRTLPAHRFLPIGSYNHVCANNNGDILMGTPTLGVQAIDALTSHEFSARYVWDPYDINGQENISEGMGGACATSLVNEEFYVYSLLWLNYGLTFRRTIDRGVSFQPYRQSGPGTPGGMEWFIKDMMLPTTTPAPKYDAPMIMWESFDDAYTYDTVWFKADTTMNFYTGDRTIYAPSKNFNYPIEYTVPYGFAHGDSIQVPDPVQNRLFVGLHHKIFMTRDALNYSKRDYPNEPNHPEQITWLALGPLDSKDTTAIFALSDDANTLYIGTKLGNVWCFTNLKNVYSKATVELAQQYLSHAFENKQIHAIAVDPTDDNHIVVVLDGGGDNVYETFNGKSESATYNLIKGKLPNNVYSVLFPKGAKKGTIMAGTENGIWMKESGSNTWSSNGLEEIPVMTLSQMTTHRPGLKNVPYFDPDPAIGKIRINYPSNNKSYLTIYVGTYGSGVYSSSAYVGIDEYSDDTVKESDALVVIPNPVTDIATIELDMTKGRATIQVFSVDGRLMEEQTARNNANTINFKDYAPGTYVIQVMQGGNVKSAKVIKQ
jgi:hypothetical protein